ncbi:response regulator transcription factor (plasmid) [Burkholderia ambifaria]
MINYLGSTRVAILDDHPVAAFGMSAYLSREGGCNVVQSCNDVATFFECIRSENLDVALVDFLLLSKFGLEVAGIKKISKWVRVVATASTSFELVKLASLRAGADSFYGKNEIAENLLRAIIRAVSGAKGKDNREGVFLNEEFKRLSRCELEVLLGCLQGDSIAEMARHKGRSIKTVSRQKRIAYQKLGIATDFELFKDERVLRLSNLLQAG